MARRRPIHPQVRALWCAVDWADRLHLEGQKRRDYIRRQEDRVIGLTSTKQFSKAKGPKK
jgi:hypothetical protein